MSGYEYGPLDSFEITWVSGHVETIQAHQVTVKSSTSRVSVLADGVFGTDESGSRITFHGEIDGRWTLVLSALEADIRTVRRVTGGEHLGAGDGAS